MSSIGIAEILSARDRIRAHVVHTPLVGSAMLDEQTGCSVLVKAESLQVTGSFKFRGALNKILQLDTTSRERGVVAFSSGNHGQGVAAAARIAGTTAVIVLPATAATVKVESCRWWGAEIVTYDPDTEHREDVARRFTSIGRTLVPPFDDHEIIAGQATVGLEMCEQFVSRGTRPDVVVVACSGGGLSSGVVLAMRHFFPDIECYIAEPAGYTKMARSLKAGHIVPNETEAKTVMDALIGRFPGTRTFSILSSQNVRAVAVSDEEALNGVAVAYRSLRLVIEPGGAAALAALVAGKVDAIGRQVAVVCSGGNVDATVFSRAIAG